METVWRFRIILFMAFAVIIFGDLLGYGNVNGEKDTANTEKYRTVEPKKKHANGGGSENEIVYPTIPERSALHKIRKYDRQSQTDPLRDACLPKMLCEIAAKPASAISEKEKSLLELIKSTTLSLVWHHYAPTRWHFAAHMGQLMRDSVDSMGGPMGCAELWPQCPFSTKALLQITGGFKQH